LTALRAKATHGYQGAMGGSSPRGPSWQQWQRDVAKREKHVSCWRTQ